MAETNQPDENSIEISPPPAAIADPSPPPPPPPPTPVTASVANAAGLSMLRLVLALGVASFADTLGVPFGELGVIVFDLCVGFVLFAILGFRVELLFATVAEAIPFVGIFPSWVLAVASIWARNPRAE